MALFINLAVLKDPIDIGAIKMGLIVCAFVTATQILIRKFYMYTFCYWNSSNVQT